MKITDWAVIFVIIIAPVVWLGGLRADNLREVNRLETRYTCCLAHGSSGCRGFAKPKRAAAIRKRVRICEMDAGG